MVNAMKDRARALTRSISAKLALYFIALAFPALLLVNVTVVNFEFRRVIEAVDRGALQTAVRRQARVLGDVGSNDEALIERLNDWVMRLERPRGGLVEQPSYVLLELSEDPLRAAIYDLDGRRVAATRVAPRQPTELAIDGARRGRLVRDGADIAGTTWRMVLAPVRGPTDEVIAIVQLDLEVPPAWRKAMADLAVEWPITLTYLVGFAALSGLFLAMYVTRRLGRIMSATDRWSRGDFSQNIADFGYDELGRLSRHLDAMAGELAEHLATRAELASLEERQRLARDLHDTVKQKAFALKLQLDAAHSMLDRDLARAGASVAESQRLVEEIQGELGTILNQLRSDSVDSALADRAHRIAADWARRSGLALQWRRCENLSLPRWIQDHVLRVLDEALANAWRHAGATRLSLELGCENDGSHVLVVSDDGRGMRGEGEGMGLRNMRERALALPEGRLEFSSAPGRGTQVRLRWRPRQPGPAAITQQRKS
jgi:signal transduction histidine kinase